jgi:hypothetical protein
MVGVLGSSLTNVSLSIVESPMWNESIIVKGGNRSLQIMKISLIRRPSYRMLSYFVERYGMAHHKPPEQFKVITLL